MTRSSCQKLPAVSHADESERKNLERLRQARRRFVKTRLIPESLEQKLLWALKEICGHIRKSVKNNIIQAFCRLKLVIRIDDRKAMKLQKAPGRRMEDERKEWGSSVTQVLR